MCHTNKEVGKLCNICGHLNHKRPWHLLPGLGNAVFLSISFLFFMSNTCVRIIFDSLQLFERKYSKI